MFLSLSHCHHGSSAHRADIALIGLAVMGQNLIMNMNDHGFVVRILTRVLSRSYLGRETQQQQQLITCRNLVVFSPSLL